MNGTIPQQIMIYLLKLGNEERNTRLEIAEQLQKPACVISRAGKKIIQRGWARKKRIYTPVTDRWRDSYNLTDEGITMAMQIKEAMA